ETVAALEVERMLSEARLARTFRAALLEDMLDGQLAPDGIRRRLAGEGFDSSEMLVLLALRSRDGADPAHALDKLNGLLRQQRTPPLVTAPDPAFLLAPDTPAVSAAIAEVAELRAGASRPFTIPDGLALARRDAQLALDIAVQRESDLVRAGSDVNYP